MIIKFKESLLELPVAQDLNEACATYYLILIKGYGKALAMYLENDDGNKGWYKDYVSLIIKEVTHWTEVNLE